MFSARFVSQDNKGERDVSERCFCESPVTASRYNKQPPSSVLGHLPVAARVYTVPLIMMEKKIIIKKSERDACRLQAELLIKQFTCVATLALEFRSRNA